MSCSENVWENFCDFFFSPFLLVESILAQGYVYTRLHKDISPTFGCALTSHFCAFLLTLVHFKGRKILLNRCTEARGVKW